MQPFHFLCTADERARHERFLFEPKQDEFLWTRALVRTTLGRYAGVDPRAFTFATNAWGRPEIETPAEHRGLRCNVSNTFGMIAVIAAVLGTIVFLIAANKDPLKAPTGVRNLAESSVTFIENDIVMQTMGKDGLPWTPLPPGWSADSAVRPPTTAGRGCSPRSAPSRSPGTR